MQHLSQAFPSVLRQVKGNDRLTLIFLQELWPQLVGEVLASRLAPVKLQGPLLLVDVSDSAWAEVVDAFADDIRKRVNRFWGCPLIEQIELQPRQ